VNPFHEASLIEACPAEKAPCAELTAL